MKRRKVRRNWHDAQEKVNAEGKCRNCQRTTEQLRAIGRRLEAAHLLGRVYDAKGAGGIRYVHPDSVIPLCGPPTDTGTCHHEFDAHRLRLWHRLNPQEEGWVLARVGEGQARRRINGRLL